MSNQITRVPTDHTINKLDADESFELDEKRTMLIIQRIKVETGAQVKVPSESRIALIGRN